MYFQYKTEILKGKGGSRLWNSEGMGGNAFWNSRRQGGGVKTWKPSVVAYGYFLELTNLDKERAAQIVVLYLLDNKIVHSNSGKDLKHVSRAVILKRSI